MPLISSPVAYPPSSSPPVLGLGRSLFSSKSQHKASPNIEVENVLPKAVAAPQDHNVTTRRKNSNTVPLANLELEQLNSLGRGLASPGAAKPQSLGNSQGVFRIKTCNGKTFDSSKRKRADPISYEQTVASRSKDVEGRAKRSHYGIEIQALLEDYVNEAPAPTVVVSVKQIPALPKNTKSKKRSLMWTEKYRARKFTDLVGDERTHRSVLRWVKRWDPIVFPGSVPAKSIGHEEGDERAHRKILILAGPPGLGKTTLAHVCAKQAGYDIHEINASDDRSSNVVKGRIRDCVGTENVKGSRQKDSGGNSVRRSGRPVCVVVDEVDGVVGGTAGSGEGGFVKALIDLVLLDQKNSSLIGATTGTSKRRKKGDDFRLLRPMILICNDVYHPCLRPLRQSNLAEIIHIRKPPINAVTSRIASIFSKEGFACDTDGVRRLCEAAWGIANRRDANGQSGSCEGDIRGVLVMAEWAARKLRAEAQGSLQSMERLSRKWIEENIDTEEGASARGVGRGGVREVVERIFKEGAGFPKANRTDRHTFIQPDVGVAEVVKRHGADQLRSLVSMCGETDRVMTECFSVYLNGTFQDDTLLSKPASACEWLHFSDMLASRIFESHDWELAPYLTEPAIAFHHLFAAPKSVHHKNTLQENADTSNPFYTQRADFAAHEATKAARAVMSELQSNLSIPLQRIFRSPNMIATELVPSLSMLLSPAVKPVVVGGVGSVRRASEKDMVARAVAAMSGCGIRFEKGRIEAENAFRGASWVYRMEPPIDDLAVFQTASAASIATSSARYAVRQVLDQEHAKHEIELRAAARAARFAAGAPAQVEEPSLPHLPEIRDDSRKQNARKRDFFGREIVSSSPVRPSADDLPENINKKKRKKGGKDNEGMTWVTFHEGFSNAVRKPISLSEMMAGL